MHGKNIVNPSSTTKPKSNMANQYAALGEGEYKVVEVEGVKDGIVESHADPKLNKNAEKVNKVHGPSQDHINVEEGKLTEVADQVKVLVNDMPLNPNVKVFTPSKRVHSPGKTKEWVQKAFYKPVEEVDACEVPSTIIDIEGERKLWSDQVVEKGEKVKYQKKSNSQQNKVGGVSGGNKENIIITKTQAQGVKSNKEDKKSHLMQKGNKVQNQILVSQSHSNTSNMKIVAVPKGNLQVVITGGEDARIDMNEKSTAHNFNNAASDGDLSPTQVSNAVGKARKKNSKDTSVPHLSGVQTR
ncbi:hypothetical protein K7X08_006179 [Anisodus acutangulus]|uniref:Uncharacterized protein n=1 Tax=Anisodus acutangulus TaxID=402998 RepID=A0A9Q1MVA2_9SOLA|nr:hypothetical protein K7X08_006179 [Anisodus acutangulus]